MSLTSTTLDAEKSISSGHDHKRIAGRMAGCMVALTLMVVMALPVKGHSAPDSFADLAERLLPSVVNISVTIKLKQPEMSGPNGQRKIPPWADPFGFFDKRGGRPDQKTKAGGSGFIVDETGIIITNHHVVDKADEVTVTLSDGTELEAEVIGADKRTDIAVLRVVPESPLPAVKFADSDKVRVGEWVIAVGNPFGLGGSVTAGIVSALGRDIGAGYYDDFIQTDAPINQGNSGGPLFNMNGDVIGINSVIISRSGGNVGIGFSIPSNMAQRVVADLQQHGHVRRGWLGVVIQSIDEDLADSVGLEKADGVMVSSVNKGEPADKGGVESGDIILEYDGEDTPDRRTLLRLVADTPAGNTVKMVVWRDGRKRTLRVVVGDMPADIDKPSRITQRGSRSGSDTLDVLGITLVSLSDKLREQHKVEDDVEGVVVVVVKRGTDASRKGLRSGDVIVELGGADILSLDDIEPAIRAVKDDGIKAILVRWVRAGNYYFEAIKFEDE